MDKIMKHATVMKWTICFSGILITLLLCSASAWATGPTVGITSPQPGEILGSSVIFAFVSDGGVSFECMIAGVGSFECVPGSPVEYILPTGQYAFYVAAYDAVGNTTSAVSDFYVDAQGPVITVTQAPGPSGAGPDSTEATEIQFFAQDPEPGSYPLTFQYWLDGIETLTSCTISSVSGGIPNGVCTWANLCNGNHLFRIVAYDSVLPPNPGPVNPDGTLGVPIAFNTSGGVPCQLTITASAGANGSISPSGAVTVNSGNDIDFMMNASTGYHIADVLVDGASVGAVGSYTFNNVTANHTITASFAMNPYNFSGFFTPVDNLPALNVAKAGQVIPVKWHIRDDNGLPISDPAGFKSLTSFSVNCDSLSGDSTSVIDDYSSGSSGLQYLDDGYWQFNWQTPKTYSGQCRTMVLTLRDGTTHTASFKFK